MDKNRKVTLALYLYISISLIVTTLCDLFVLNSVNNEVSGLLSRNFEPWWFTTLIGSYALLFLSAFLLTALKLDKVLLLIVLTLPICNFIDITTAIPPYNGDEVYGFLASLMIRLVMVCICISISLITYIYRFKVEKST